MTTGEILLLIVDIIILLAIRKYLKSIFQIVLFVGSTISIIVLTAEGIHGQMLLILNILPWIIYITGIVVLEKNICIQASIFSFGVHIGLYLLFSNFPKYYFLICKQDYDPANFKLNIIGDFLMLTFSFFLDKKRLL